MVTQNEKKYHFKLYVSGATSKSGYVISTVKELLDKNIPNNYQIEIIDAFQQPQKLNKFHIHALPTLLRVSPQPIIKITGDLSNTDLIWRQINDVGKL